jgi:hypothetical protein
LASVAKRSGAGQCPSWGPVGRAERMRFARLIHRPVRILGRTCGPRRLRRQSHPAQAATQSGRSAPPFAGHLLEVRPGRVDPETKAQGRALKRTTALSDTLLEETKVWRTANRLTRHAGSPNDSVAVESAGSMTQNRCSPTDGLRRPKACRTLAGPARGGASCRQQGQTDPRSDLASDWRGRHPAASGSSEPDKRRVQRRACPASPGGKAAMPTPSRTLGDP